MCRDQATTVLSSIVATALNFDNFQPFDPANITPVLSNAAHCYDQLSSRARSALFDFLGKIRALVDNWAIGSISVSDLERLAPDVWDRLCKLAPREGKTGARESPLSARDNIRDRFHDLPQRIQELGVLCKFGVVDSAQRLRAAQELQAGWNSRTVADVLKQSETLMSFTAAISVQFRFLSHFAGCVLGFLRAFW